MRSALLWRTPVGDLFRQIRTALATTTVAATSSFKGKEKPGQTGQECNIKALKSLLTLARPNVSLQTEPLGLYRGEVLSIAVRKSLKYKENFGASSFWVILRMDE